MELPRVFGEGVQNAAFEEQSYARGFKCIAGVDEVGRGPLAGPVVAAAVILPRGFSSREIQDSKLLTSGQREKAAVLIRKQAVSLGLGIVEVGDIDRINVLNASFLAMVKACEALQPSADCILIDGNRRIPRELFGSIARSVESLPRQKVVIKGDRLCLSIAAASILAKVTRDSIMLEVDKLYPEYGFATHKGYGCAAHVEALRRFGPSPVHRRSFQPVLDAYAEQVASVDRTLFSTR